MDTCVGIQLRLMCPNQHKNWTHKILLGIQHGHMGVGIRLGLRVLLVNS